MSTCVHLRTAEFSPGLDFSEVKGSKSLFRWVDLLRPIMLLHCDRLEAERQSGRNKDKGGIKEENPNSTSAFVYLTLSYIWALGQFSLYSLLNALFPSTLQATQLQLFPKIPANNFGCVAIKCCRIGTLNQLLTGMIPLEADLETVYSSSIYK